jgi:hypothetical protein
LQGYNKSKQAHAMLAEKSATPTSSYAHTMGLACGHRTLHRHAMITVLVKHDDVDDRHAVITLLVKHVLQH